MNNILWWCDPDTLLVGEAPIETARLATAVVALPGQMMFAGDKLAELTPERMRLLQQALPVCDVKALDLYPIFELTPVWDLKIKRPLRGVGRGVTLQFQRRGANSRDDIETLGASRRRIRLL